MEGPQSFPMPTYICGVQARPYLKKDVPQDNQDFLATRQVTAESLGVRPEYIEILPVLSAPECSTAIVYSQWLTTLQPDIAMGTLPFMIMDPTLYTKHLRFCSTATA